MADQDPPVIHQEFHAKVHEHKPMVCGGYGEERPANDHINQVVHKVRKDVEAKHGAAEVYEVVSYRSQVVAGTNYQVKLRLGPNKVVDIKIFEPLPGKDAEPRLVE
ncbi:cystatin-A-like [Paramacrobiotus metropolitanus]|uniref:cystatin-A-like n=1 Tax=Paramacrobiotus metropolitanus TaxID=2943436 RepID=UPI002445E2FF|nr:cystatin-A-like [Paramacrobiotus metropolitanus]